MARSPNYRHPIDPNAPVNNAREFFSRALRIALKKQDWSPADLARQTTLQGVKTSRQIIGTYLLLLNMPRQHRLEAIARALHTTPVALTGTHTGAWREESVHYLPPPKPMVQVAPMGSPPALPAPVTPIALPTEQVRHVTDAAAEATSYDFEGDQVRLKIDRVLSPEIALRVMKLLLDSAK